MALNISDETLLFEATITISFPSCIARFLGYTDSEVCTIGKGFAVT